MAEAGYARSPPLSAVCSSALHLASLIAVAAQTGIAMLAADNHTTAG